MKFQAFADADGITTRFRMDLRNISWLRELYDAWRAENPTEDWESGPIVSIQRRGKDVVELCHANGTVVSIKLRKTLTKAAA
jgi:hypothetical protein